jgi:mono/diheme cytochrome c family protein
MVVLSVAGLSRAAGPFVSRPAPATPAQTEFFETRIRPLFLEHCAACHGPKKQMGGLRLDTRTGFHQGGDNGPVVQPGQPDSSRLVQALRHTGELKMPPRKKLPADLVAAVEAWVRQGSPWPEDRVAGHLEAWRRHWAFQPVTDPAPPIVRATHWPRTGLDRFILSALERRSLSPSPEADRATLLRRLSFDLLGLPPMPVEIAAFQQDSAPDAWEKVVDRLLASPTYGERWGRYWLDVARYADTKGYVFFEEARFPWAWTYRDYVLEAFNGDLPYDRFLLEQLAADQLTGEGDRRSLRALGFVTLGGRFMNNVHDILDDRIDVVSRGLLGLTVSCARCHDHKFDPIPSADYYALHGVFANSIEPAIPPLYEEPAPTPQYHAFREELQKREAELESFVKAKRAEVMNGARTRVAEYLLAAHARRGQPTTEEFMLIADGSDLNPAMLTRWQAYLERKAKSPHRVWAPWHRLAELPDKEFAARAGTILLELQAGRCGGEPVNPRVARALAEAHPRTLAEAAGVYSRVLNEIEKQWQEMQKRTPAADRFEDAEREELRLVFHGPDAPPDVPRGLINDLDLLPDRPSQGRLRELRTKVEQWLEKGPGAPPRAHTLVDRPVPVASRVFRRGNPNNPGEFVPRRFLAVLSGPGRTPFRQGSGRLELARAVADPRNPLTARVLVNRVWMHHFGRPLVGTPSDFGLRSDPPSHPDLLDHLASEFVRDGWSIKRLHRRILLSAAWRQASLDRPECRKVDPENILLWRMNRRRLDFEATRDALLAVAGKLDACVGGPSVPDILQVSSRRRTLYGSVDRLQVPGLYRAFDYPAPDSSASHRDQTTVPQQALFFLNSPLVLDSASQLLARPEVSGEPDLKRRVQTLYLLCYGRPPTPAELSLAAEFLTNAPRPEWLRYTQALLLANEFVFVD